MIVVLVCTLLWASQDGTPIVETVVYLQIPMRIVLVALIDATFQLKGPLVTAVRPEGCLGFPTVFGTW